MNLIATVLADICVFVCTHKTPLVIFTVRLHVMQCTVLLSQFCLFVCPTVCLSDACIVTKLNDALRYFDTTRNGHCSFVTPTMVGGRCPLLCEIFVESDPSRMRNSSYSVSNISYAFSRWRFGRVIASHPVQNHWQW